MKEEVKVVLSPYVVFYINRRHLEQKVIKGKLKYREVILLNEVVPVEAIQGLTLVLGNESGLTLSAVVIHKSNHYTCYYKCRGIWYYYDDTKVTSKQTGLKKIGSFGDLLKSYPKVTTNGTLFFYTRSPRAKLTTG